MNKTLLTSAVLLALSSSSFAADFEHTGTLDLSNPPQGFDKSATYDNLTVTNTAVTENGLRGNASMTLRVNNQLTISSVNGGITLNSENTDFAVNAPHITIKNVGALSGIHLDGAGSTVKVQNFKTFTIDATGKDEWDLYQGNGLRVHQGKSINLIGQAGSSIKINAAQSGLVVTNDGNISLSADNIEISTWGRGASNPQKPYKGQGVTVTLKSSKAPTNYFTPNILRKSWSRLVVSVVHLDALAFPVAAT